MKQLTIYSMMTLIPVILFTDIDKGVWQIIISIICLIPLIAYSIYEKRQNDRITIENAKNVTELKSLHSEHQKSLNEIIELNKQNSIVNEFSKNWENRWNTFTEKYGYEDNGFGCPRYFNFIELEYSKKDIELLFKTNLLSKTKYETFINQSNCIG